MFFKHLAELRYVAASCQDIKAIIKLDDDMGWNVMKAAHFINNELKQMKYTAQGSSGKSSNIYKHWQCNFFRRANHSPIYRPGTKW